MRAVIQVDQHRQQIYSAIQYYLVLSYAFEVLGCVFTDTASDHLEFAKKLLVAGKYSDALPHFHEAINNDPNNYLTFFKRATVYLALNRPNSALDDLNRALELNPKFTSARGQRASLLVKMGSLDEAHIDYERFISEEPDNLDAAAMYHRIEQLKTEIAGVKDLIDEHQYDMAVKKLEPIVQALPFSTELLRLRAQALQKLGEVRRAISDYRTIAKLNVDTSTYLTISKLSYQLGEVEESLNNVRECLKLDPDHKSCMEFYKPIKKLNNHIQNMLSSKAEKDNDECYVHGKNALRALKDDPKQIALIFSIQSVMCHCLSRAGDLKEGLRICEEALGNSAEGGIEGIAIDKPDIICDKADLLADGEDYAEALKLYQKSQKLRQSKRARDGIEKMTKFQKRAKRRNYYKILGVDSNANEEQINRAYRKLAAKWHPDRHQDSESKKAAEKMFMDIADAKAVLTDPEKRQLFDQGQDPLDPESKQQVHRQGFYGDPSAHFGNAGGYTFRFNF